VDKKHAQTFRRNGFLITRMNDGRLWTSLRSKFKAAQIKRRRKSRWARKFFLMRRKTLRKRLIIRSARNRIRKLKGHKHNVKLSRILASKSLKRLLKLRRKKDIKRFQAFNRIRRTRRLKRKIHKLTTIWDGKSTFIKSRYKRLRNKKLRRIKGR
jgi:hypothetical protein